jgi:hypothetical protein
MKKLFFILSLLLFNPAFAKEAHKPDTVIVGIYITSLHDIDFKSKEYNINLWLWLKYKNRDFDFSKYLEVPMAKSFQKSYYTVDTLADGRIYMLMKLQCVMKDSWKIDNFPFDKQAMRFSIENSQYDASNLVFVQDTLGEHFSEWTLSGWKIIPDSFNISIANKNYETTFGDPALKVPHSEFSAYTVQIGIERYTWGLFLKLFIGMYISFLLSFLCFFIHNDNIDSRFSLSVGSLFAVIGNKYVIDSSLPESTTFTLVDSLHMYTLIYIFATVTCSVYVLKLVKAKRIEDTRRFDKISGAILLTIYLFLNIYSFYNAYYGLPSKF